MKTINARWHGGVRPSTNLIVLHSTENDLRKNIARDVAQYFAKGSVKASAHFIVDHNEIIQCVDPTLIAWAAPGSNDIGLQIEMCGRAKWTREQWQLPMSWAMIQKARALVHALASEYDIPLVRVNVAGLAAGKQGITRHMDVTRAFRRSTHVDPGVGFDMQWIIE